MSVTNDRSKLTVEMLAAEARGEMISLSNQFYYFAALPVAEEDLKQYLQEPLASMSPKIRKLLPKLGVLLVPYLEKGNGKHSALVVHEQPPENRSLYATRSQNGDMEWIAIAIKDEEMADYHYTLFSAIASVIAERWPDDVREQYTRLLREELKLEVHGEVDERSWHLKQGLLRRQANIRKESKIFQDYARQSFSDTLTLYLHGTCCDIDVETGPRQLPSLYIRKRLEMLQAAFPPPEGYMVLPEHMRKREKV
jgi:hypothetical protein